MGGLQCVLACAYVIHTFLHAQVHECCCPAPPPSCPSSFLPLLPPAPPLSSPSCPPCVCRWCTGLWGDCGEHGTSRRQKAIKGTLYRHHLVTRLVTYAVSAPMLCWTWFTRQRGDSLWPSLHYENGESLDVCVCVYISVYVCT